MADHVASATGNQVTLCTSNYGTATGSMIFFMGFDSAESVDATQETLMSDSTYMEAMGKTAELFLPDGQRTPHSAPELTPILRRTRHQRHRVRR